MASDALHDGAGMILELAGGHVVIRVRICVWPFGMSAPVTVLAGNSTVSLAETELRVGIFGEAKILCQDR